MTATISLTLDGHPLQVRPGTTVLEAALANGIDIPRLCYHPELTPSGGCRLCLVQVAGRPAPQASCGLQCEAGMVVDTRTPELEAMRKDLLDLFLSDHPLRCAVCDKNGACDLQKYAYQYGLAETSLNFEPDALVNWGLFNAVFEQKEYLESYVAEELARTMLADPATKAAFDEALKDKDFAASPERRLDWFYRRSPLWDERVGLVPVFRVDAVPAPAP